MVVRKCMGKFHVGLPPKCNVSFTNIHASKSSKKIGRRQTCGYKQARTRFIQNSLDALRNVDKHRSDECKRTVFGS